MNNPNNGSDPDLREAAQILNIPLDTLRRRAQRGRIGAYKVGGRWFIPVQDTERNTVPLTTPEQNYDNGVNNAFWLLEIERLHAELERVWAEVRERDVLIERLTARPVLSLPEPPEQLSQPSTEPARLNWWQRLLWWEPA